MSLKHRARIARHPDLIHYDFGPQHPLRPERIVLGMDLLERSGLWNPATQALDVSPAPEAELELVHDPRYIRAIHNAGSGYFPRGELANFGVGPGDNPSFPNMHEASALVAGATVQAARSVMTGEIAHAFNPAGGLHHAHRDRASGFCIYNDPAVAIAVIQKEFGARVLYVDVDCHHGDGVQWLFYDNPKVLTVSFHETGRYLFPGTGDIQETGVGMGTGYSINVPMAPFTRDQDWLFALEAILPELGARFKPDIVVSAHGADTHVWDPLTHVQLTTRAFAQQARLIHNLVHEHAGGRWLAVGSGGYDWRRVVPRSWTILWAEMSGMSLPDTLPASWLEGRDHQDEPLPSLYLDTDEIVPPLDGEDEIRGLNRETVRQVQSLVQAFPGAHRP